jgi:hypothetical protein
MSTARSLARLAATSAALLLVAACADAPDPTAPATPAARPSLDITSPGGGTTPIPTPLTVWVKLHVGDQASYGLPVGVPGTTVSFVTNGGTVKTIADNSAEDTDPAVGFYRVAMPSSISYTAYVRIAPEYLTTAGAFKTVSAYVTPTLVDMGSIVLKRKPGVYVSLMKQGVLVPGQTIKVSQVGGVWSVTITDGSSQDISAVAGKIHLRVPVTGTYMVCALTSPSALWDAGCEQVFALQYFVAYPVTLTYALKYVFTPL